MIFNNIDSPKTPVKCNGTVKNGEMSSLASRIPNGLAELFAGGSMPKLKPTGLAMTGMFYLGSFKTGNEESNN